MPRIEILVNKILFLSIIEILVKKKYLPRIEFLVKIILQNFAQEPKFFWKLQFLPRINNFVKHWNFHQISRFSWLHFGKKLNKSIFSRKSIFFVKNSVEKIEYSTKKKVWWIQPSQQKSCVNLSMISILHKIYKYKYISV